MMFLEKLRAIQRQNQSWIGLSLDVQIRRMPAPMARVDDPMFPFARALVDATRDVVCTYLIDLGYFLSEGAPGTIALERIVRYIPDEIPIILDGKFGDVGHSAEAYARAAYEAYRADAVTLSPNPDRATLTAFLSQANMATFVPARSPQPIDTLVSHAKTWSQSLPGTCGVIVEAGKLARVRSSAPDMPVLITSFNALKDEITPVAKYGPTPNGMGPIVDAGSSILYASSRDDFAEAAHVAARAWRDRLNAQSSVERDSARA